MADYAETTTITSGPRAQRVSRDVHMITGTCNLTNWHATVTEIDEITEKFTTILAVVPCGPSDAGYLFSWDATNKAFLAWMGDLDATADGPMIALTDDTDAGQITFVAYGLA